VGQDRVRDHRRGGEAVVGVDPHLDPVRVEHLEDRPEGGLGEGVRVAAEEQRAVDALRAAVAADRLADGQHVRLVEGPREGLAAVAGRAERDALLRDRRVGPLLVVRRDYGVGVDQIVPRRWQIKLLVPGGRPSDAE
jgi:hypothetical protein